MMAGADSVAEPEPTQSSDGASQGSSIRRWLVSGAKLLVTLALCWLIISWIDWQAFLATVKGADYRLIAVVFALSLVGVVVSAWKWQILLDGHGIRFPIFALTRWYFIAAFFNAFLPTNIGGDGYRLMKTYHNPKGRARAVGAILLERVTGILTLGFMGYLAALIVWLKTGNPLAGSLAVIGTIGGLSGLLALVLIWRVGLIGPFSRIKMLKKIVDTATDVLADWKGQAGRLAAVMALSTIFHLLRIGFIWLLILALGRPLDPAELTMGLFAVEVAAMLPISLGGLGVMEGSFVYVMSGFGLAHEAGLAGMLMLRVLTLLIGLIGALLYLADGKKTPSAHDM